jgi:hypothetical protein
VDEDEHGTPVIAGFGLARLTVTLLARVVLFSALGLLAWASLPAVIGWTPTTVMTGSMMPRIHAGDVVVSRPVPAGSAALKQILLVDDPDHPGRLRLHRFAEFAPDGDLILRGDANPANDSTPVAPAAVHGVAVLRIPFMGLPIVWFTEHAWGPLATVLVAVAGLTVAAAGSSAAPLRDGPDRPSGPAAKPRKPRPGRAIQTGGHTTVRRSRRLRALLAVAAVPVLAWPATSATAQASFSSPAPTQTSSFSALASYPCTYATLPDSPYLFYRFNEGSGTAAADASGNARNGTLQGATTWEPGSCSAGPSPALTLGGSPGYVSTAAALTAPDIFTVEIWFKTPRGSTTGGRLIGFGNAQTGNSAVSDRHLYMTTTGAIVFGAAPNPGSSTNYKASAITSAPDMNNANKFYNDGAWHQATATMSSSGMKLYLDGSLVNQSTVKSGAEVSGFWRVGYDALSTNSWPGVTGNPVFAGTVDNAAVYPAALTATQVQDHFAAGH